MVDVNLFFKYAENNKKNMENRDLLLSLQKNAVDFLIIFDNLNVKKFYLNISFY